MEVTQIPLSAAVADLQVLMNNLDPYDRKFAESLINGPYGYKQKGSLSPKQAPYIFSLLEKAMGTQEVSKPLTLSVDRIAAMFAKAKEKLKWPKVVFETNFGRVSMWTQGQKAKFPGSIAVTVDKVWLGRIGTEGTFHSGKMFSSFQTKDQLLELLIAFSKDPEAVAAHYGKLHSKCVFCLKSLNDPKSLAVGYGPICAVSFGLKWGTEKLSVAEAVS